MTTQELPTMTFHMVYYVIFVYYSSEDILINIVIMQKEMQGRLIPFGDKCWVSKTHRQIC